MDERGRLQFDAPALTDAGEHVAKVGEAGAVNSQFVVGLTGHEHGMDNRRYRSQPMLEGLASHPRR